MCWKMDIKKYDDKGNEGLFLYKKKGSRFYGLSDFRPLY